jgi:hypothetical protein
MLAKRPDTRVKELTYVAENAKITRHRRQKQSTKFIHSTFSLQTADGMKCTDCKLHRYTRSRRRTDTTRQDKTTTNDYTEFDYSAEQRRFGFISRTTSTAVNCSSTSIGKSTGICFFIDGRNAARASSAPICRAAHVCVSRA